MGADLRGQAYKVMALSVLAAAVTAAVCPFLGGSGMDYAKLFRQEAPDWNIFLNLRVPRTLLALLTGAALSGAGAVFQALLRDALATPSSLGVTAAASLGAVSAIALFPGDDASFPVVWVSALCGAAAVIALVSALGQARRFSSFTLLLTGIAINGICTAVILLLHSMAGITKSFQITHWLMGGIDAVEYRVLLWLAIAIVPACVWMLRILRGDVGHRARRRLPQGDLAGIRGGNHSRWHDNRGHRADRICRIDRAAPVAQGGGTGLPAAAACVDPRRWGISCLVRHHFAQCAGACRSAGRCDYGAVGRAVLRLAAVVSLA
jgi:hypothetical protein